MAQSSSKLVSPASLAIDAVLVILFFAFMCSVIAPHVPTNDAKWITVWSALCSACLSGVFWLTLQMFRVVLRAQREAKAGTRK